MRKQLMKGVAVLVLGGLTASCSHDETDYSTYVDSKLQTFQEVFTDAYGKIDPTQTWGFKTTAKTSRMTRAARKAMPERPTFRDNLASAIAKPATPTFSTTLPAGTTYAQNVGQNNWQDGQTVYIDANYASVDQNKSNLVIYATGTLTFNGWVSQNGNGTTIIVTENSNLTLQNVVNNLKVYLAPNAKLTLGDATFQNANAELYLSSGSQVTAGKLQFTNSTKVLNAGGTITATSLTLDQGNTLWNEGTITVTEALTCTNSDDKIYNAPSRTITAGSIDLINNNALLYNNGRVTSNGEIKTHNSQAEIVNNGTLSGTALNMGAGGKMHNVGTTNISGKTDLTNSNSQWMNDGQYTSGSFDVDNYSKQNYNNCRLTVLGNFYLNRGEFVIDANASVVTNTFTWEDTSNFYLGSQSMLSVAGRLLTRNANSGYGFRAYGDDYAVIQAQEITHEGNEQFRMSYFGKLYVATSSHFGQWYKDAPSNTQQPAYYYEPTVKFAFSDPDDANVMATLSPVSIPASACSPGYEGPTPEEISLPLDNVTQNEEQITISTTNIHYQRRQLIEQGRVFCEDLGQISTNDFDYNDVVFDAYVYEVTPITQTIVTEDGVEVSDNTVEGEPTYETTIVLLAAGGTLQLSLAGIEVHNALGGNPTSAIINTIENAEGSFGNIFFTEDPVVLGTDFNYATIADIPIIVHYGNGTTLELKAETGWAPHKFLVPIGTKWCKERQEMATVYKDFNTYVSSSVEFWKANADGSNIVKANLYEHPKDTYQERSAEPETIYIGTDDAIISYRSISTIGDTGYQGEEVLSRQRR